MKNTMKAMVVAALLASACGSGLGNGGAQGGTSEGMAYDGTAYLRIRGVNGGAYSAVLLGVDELEVRAGGALLASIPVDDQLDLANMGNAWLLAQVEVPAGVSELEVRVVLSEGGGFVAGNASGAIEAPCGGFTFKVPVVLLADRSHAVVHLDVTRSLVPREDGSRLLLPQFSVHF